MSSSTIVREPLDLYGEFLFYGNDTLKKRKERNDFRGASLFLSGLRPGEIGIISCNEYGGTIDDLAFYGAPSAKDREDYRLTGNRINDEPSVSKRSNHMSVNGNTLQIDLESKDKDKVDDPPCIFDCYTTIETEQGTEFSKEQISTVEDNSIGIALIDCESGSGIERISFYKAREKTHAALGALTEEEKKLVAVSTDGTTLFDVRHR